MNRIAVFARWPEPGRVKTRLAPALTAALACDLHRAMLGDALATVRAAAAGARTLHWAGAPGQRGAFPAPPGFDVLEQRGTDLGARLAHAVDGLLEGAGDRAVIVGADCPDLAPRHIATAFEALETHDLAIGPASDGGYYLIGLARPAPGLFRGVAWGTERVLSQTLERAAALGLGVRRLETLGDLDTPGDLVRWLARAAFTETGQAALTRELVRSWGLLPPSAEPRTAPRASEDKVPPKGAPPDESDRERRRPARRRRTLPRPDRPRRAEGE